MAIGTRPDPANSNSRPILTGTGQSLSNFRTIEAIEGGNQDIRPALTNIQKLDYQLSLREFNRCATGFRQTGNRYGDAMLVLALETGILILLIKMFTDNEVGFWLPLFTAIVTAFATAFLAAFCVGLMGLWGILVGVVLSAVLLACFLTILFGVEFQKSLFIGGVFVFAHIGIHVGLYLMVGS